MYHIGRVNGVRELVVDELESVRKRKEINY